MKLAEIEEKSRQELGTVPLNEAAPGQKRVLLRAEGGLVTAVFWQPEPEKKTAEPKKSGKVPETKKAKKAGKAAKPVKAKKLEAPRKINLEKFKKKIRLRSRLKKMKLKKIEAVKEISAPKAK